MTFPRSVVSKAISLISLAVSLAACGSDAAGPEGELQTTPLDRGPASTNGPSSSAVANKIPLGEEGGWTGNIVPKNGHVLVDFGPLHHVQSADPMKHVFLRGIPGVSPDRVFLAASVMDLNTHLTLAFEVDYTDESTPIELVPHGHLDLMDAGPMRIATAGFVTVSKVGAERLRLAFSGLELGTESEPGVVSMPEPMDDGSVEGDVVRVCRNGLQQDADNTFCAVPE